MRMLSNDEKQEGDPIVPISHDLQLDPKLPEDIVHIAAKQGENETTKYNLIQELRNLIQDKEELMTLRSDDEFLTKFLRSRFWKVPGAFVLFQNYYQFRQNNRNYFYNCSPSDLEVLGDHDIINVAPYKDDAGRRIITYRFGNWIPSKIPIDHIFKASVLLSELGALEPVSQVMGVILIFDMKNLSLTQVVNLTPSIAQKMLQIMVTSMPMRTYAIHIVNQNWMFSAAFNVFKPFLNHKMRKSIFIHGTDFASLHNHIKPLFLPERYGGKREDYPYRIWIDNLTCNDEVVSQLENLGYQFPKE